ncbi:MAG: hypothetical protein ACM3PY_07375 [Omnitrophica WOR_2 bacterium]
MVRRLLVLIFSVLMLTMLSACSKTSSSGQPVEVKVTAGDFYFKSSLTTFQQGVQYHFVVTNTGNVAHELMIMKPMETTGNMEEMDKQALAHIEETDLQPGKAASIDYTFTQAYSSGTLELACHLQGHYEQGMHLDIEVK